MGPDYLKSRDLVKLAFQFQETEYIPYTLELSDTQVRKITEYYGSSRWLDKVITYIDLKGMTGVDNFLSLEHGSGAFKFPGDMSIKRDSFGCSWKLGESFQLVDWPLKKPEMGSYRLPDLEKYFKHHIRQRWPEDLKKTDGQFRVMLHGFGLFERSWSLRSFEGFLMDIAANDMFVEELLDYITDWMTQSIDLMVQAPIDAVFLTDDHAYQKGMIIGAAKWRKLFKPRWKKIYDRVHHYGLYTIMHMCGDTSEVIPDLIDIGLDCMESCQPEAMDIYSLKKKYGKYIRFWGGLGVQDLMAFRTPDMVRKEVKKLKKHMGLGGGYILAGAKPFGEEVSVENITAFIEEASIP